jgi:hypothetical protein
VGEALAVLQETYGKETLPLLDQGRMKKGVLVFVRGSSGGLTRVKGVQETLAEPEPTLVLATAMEGG